MVDVLGAPPRVFMAWYKRNQWPRLREVSADPSRLAATYDEWLADANRQLEEIRARGTSVSRVVVDVEELVEWCQRRGRKVDPASAAEFAASLAEQRRGVLEF